MTCSCRSLTLPRSALTSTIREGFVDLFLVRHVLV